MTKLKNKSRRFNKPSATSVIAVAAFFLALIALGNVWQMQYTLSLWSNLDMQQSINDNRWQARYEFCFNNGIRPCDDVSIREFNNQPENKESDNTFNLFTE
ncbi:MAG TPA: hypothetical protein VFM68_02810 [Candidatus Saccharimonadales bacterium]|nr:hypothetical protein [Candidatus Saccharimonadales bacterium]